MSLIQKRAITRRIIELLDAWCPVLCRASAFPIVLIAAHISDATTPEERRLTILIPESVPKPELLRILRIMVDRIGSIIDHPGEGGAT